MLRIVFFGTPTFALPFVETLHADARFEVVGIVTQPDAEVGRKKVLTAPPVAEFAKTEHIPLLQPNRIRKNTDFLESLASLNADVFVVVAYGKILPESILSMPQHGTINVHPSHLPAYRGPSPMQASLRNGDAETAVTIMKMDVEMDHGPILAVQSIPLEPTDVLKTLETKVHDIAPTLLANTIAEYTEGAITPTEQNHEDATYCHLLTRQDGYIHPSDSAQTIWNKWRAYYPWPGVTIETASGTKYKIHGLKAPITDTAQSAPELRVEENQLYLATNGQKLEITMIQEEGRSPVPADAFMRGLSKQNGPEPLKEVS